MLASVKQYAANWVNSDYRGSAVTWYYAIEDGSGATPNADGSAQPNTCSLSTVSGALGLTCKVYFYGDSPNWCYYNYVYYGLAPAGARWSRDDFQYTTRQDHAGSSYLFTSYPVSLREEYTCYA